MERGAKVEATVMGLQTQKFQSKNSRRICDILSPRRSFPHPLMNQNDLIRVDRPTTTSRIFAHTRWDIVPTAAAMFHLAYFVGLFLIYPHTPLWIMLILGLIYSLMMNANIIGVSHNFIHNPYFRSDLANRLFGVANSV